MFRGGIGGSASPAAKIPEGAMISFSPPKGSSSRLLRDGSVVENEERLTGNDGLKDILEGRETARDKFGHILVARRLLETTEAIDVRLKFSSEFYQLSTRPPWE